MAQELTASQRHRRTVTVSTAASIVAICAVIIPSASWLLKEKFITIVSDAVAGEIKNEVQAQLRPVNDGFKVLLQNTIAELEDEIAALEYEKEAGNGSWTPLDAQELTSKRRRLAAQRKALAAIESAETSN